MGADRSEAGQRARRRIAFCPLPFVFLMYVICYVDRVNVSFANLRMNVDLGFSDRVFGLGAGIFFRRLRVGVKFVGEPIKAFATRLRGKGGKDIWMMGGAGIIASFLDEGEIDQVYGRRAFH